MADGYCHVGTADRGASLAKYVQWLLEGVVSASPSLLLARGCSAVSLRSSLSFRYVNVTSGDIDVVLDTLATKGPLAVAIDASHKVHPATRPEIHSNIQLTQPRS